MGTKAKVAESGWFLSMRDMGNYPEETTGGPVPERHICLHRNHPRRECVLHRRSMWTSVRNARDAMGGQSGSFARCRETEIRFPAWQ